MNRNMKQPSGVSSGGGGGGGSGAGTGERQKINKPSQLLTQEENDVVFSLLGRKCQSQSTAVVQIYKTDGTAHSHWKKKQAAVVCFVKDSSKRSYFMRAYCLYRNEMCWEQELYDDMVICKSRPFLITFEGNDGNVALNFSSEDECDHFFYMADKTIQTRKEKRQARKNRTKSIMAPSKPPAPVIDQDDTSKVILRKNQTGSSTPYNQHHQPALPIVPVTPQKNTGFKFSMGKDKKKDKPKRFNKEDISLPTHFVHVRHVGWDITNGLDLSNDDEELKNFFNKAGVSENELNDRDTRQFIYEFVQKHNVIKQNNEPKTKPAPGPPPVPTRHPLPQHQQSREDGSQRTAPPPPPPNRQPPPPIPTTAVPTRGPPVRPPPIQVNSPPAAPPPPPPPPPPGPPMPSMNQSLETRDVEVKSNAIAAPPDARSKLMDDIQKGIVLKKVDHATLSTGSGDSRKNLMDEIHKGFQLKPAGERELPNRISVERAVPENGEDDLARVLRKALEERSKAIHSSDEASDNSDYDANEWEV